MSTRFQVTVKTKSGTVIKSSPITIDPDDEHTLETALDMFNSIVELSATDVCIIETAQKELTFTRVPEIDHISIEGYTALTGYAKNMVFRKS